MTTTRQRLSHRMAALIVAGLVWVHGSTHAATYAIATGGKSRVVFTSKALMETFQGKTDKMSGTFTVNPDSLGDSLTVHVEVDLESLDTGIDMRNRHMRENHLETDRFPLAVFDGAALTPSQGRAIQYGADVSVEIEGTFTLHGVSRRLRTAVRVSRIDLGGRAALTFRTEFPVSLDDYAISRPEFLFLKLGGTQRVVVEGVAFEIATARAGHR